MPPIVISASRRTDIPAFYMTWFMDSIDQGFFDVVNPYNRKTYQVPAGSDQVHSIVFWSKNFGPFLRHRHGQDLKGKGYNLFFNFTINASHSSLEPMIPPLEDRLEQLAALVQSFGPQCLQWRFDPICFYMDGAGREGNNLDGFNYIAHRAADLGIKACITSFADRYRKVVSRMKRHSHLELIDPPMHRKVETIEALSHKLASLGMDLRLCCEKEVLASLPEDLPVLPAACIPGHHLVRLYGPGISLAKDKGQRRSIGCACNVSRDIGSYDLHPCSHDCLFCYANPKIDGRS
ncbi:MAG: DUF1848 family protein [Desulfobacteraceae bacterium]